MMTKTKFNETERVEMNEMQYYRFFSLCTHRPGIVSKSTFYRLSDETLYEDSRNAVPQEKQCAGHIVRKIGNGINKIEVIRDDGTVWSIYLDSFKEVTPLEVMMI